MLDVLSVKADVPLIFVEPYWKSSAVPVPTGTAAAEGHGDGTGCRRRRSGAPITLIAGLPV